MNLSTAAADEALRAAASEETVEEPEELDTLDDIEVLEELEELESEEAGTEGERVEVSGESSDISDADIAALASQIEFSPEIVQESPADDSFREDLEVVSPFSTILSRLDDDGNFSFFAPGENKEEGADSEDTVSFGEDSSALDEPASESENAGEPEAALEEISEPLPLDSVDDELKDDADSAKGLSIISMPFFGMPANGDIRSLEVLPEDDDNDPELIVEEIEPVDVENVIEEREGVHYVSEDAAKPSPETAASLNREFKNLVDSIIK
jgi:hypothetical protein